MNWKEVDRKTDNADMKDDPYPASYALSNSDECRFIWLTQIGQPRKRCDELVIRAFGVFGTLLGSPSLAAAEDNYDYD
jgi:hypothetical protein